MVETDEVLPLECGAGEDGVVVLDLGGVELLCYELEDHIHQPIAVDVLGVGHELGVLGAEGNGSAGERSFAPKVIEHAAARQKRILREAARLVKPGGRLVYSTCTYSYLENEKQVIDLIIQRRDFKAVDLAALEAYKSPHADVRGCYRLWPHRDRGCGAFAARLVRSQDAGTEPDQAKPLIKTKTALRTAKKLDFEWSEWGTWSRSAKIVAGGPALFEIPEDIPHALRRIARSAPELAFRKGKTWFPAYALAMRRDEAFAPHQTVSLDADQAAAYASGAPVEGPNSGWTLVTHQLLPLGWAKGNGRVLSNHLPQAARILPEVMQRADLQADTQSW